MEIGIWTLATAELNGPMTPIDGRVGHERRHVLGALLRVVDAVDGVVEDRGRDRVAVELLNFLDRERARPCGRLPRTRPRDPDSGSVMPIFRSLPLLCGPTAGSDDDGRGSDAPRPLVRTS